MKLLIKIGGTLLESEERRSRLTAEIAAVARDHQAVLVHGGGKRLSRYLKAQGIASEFRQGFRVTPPEILEAVVQVLAGSVNHELVAAFQREGARAVGLSGIDSGLVTASPLGSGFGAVGRIESANTELLDLLAQRGYLPVVACIAAGPKGEIYNVNADQMAVACATQFQADKLIFLTDVEAVLDEHDQPIHRLTSMEAEALIDSGVARGGMEAKLRAAIAGVTQGIAEVRIVAANRPSVLRSILAGQQLGTTLLPH